VSSEDGQDASAPPLRVQATTVLPIDGPEEVFGGATAAEGLAPPPSAEVSAIPSELRVEPEAWSSRPGADDRQTVAVAPSLPNPDAPAPTAAAAEGETPAIPVDAEPAPTPVVDVHPVCEAVGPFAQRALAETFVASQPVAVASDGIREERVPRPARHWVLGPAQPNKEAVAAYLSALQAAGVKDAWRAQSGVLAGRLVVGVFSTDENARRHAAMLAGKGVATEIRKQQTDETRWWVDVRRGGDAAAVHAPDGVLVVPRDCGRVAPP
jgi:hypothetical protein